MIRHENGPIFCHFCGQQTGQLGAYDDYVNWSLVQLSWDVWEVVCLPCIDVSGLDEGK